jgi:hypothetical protein
MTTQLHILTRPANELTAAIIAAQRESGQRTVEIVDLTQPEPDYAALVEKVFAADSVAAW